MRRGYNRGGSVAIMTIIENKRGRYKTPERLPVEIPEQRSNGVEHPGNVGQLLQEPAACG